MSEFDPTTTEPDDAWARMTCRNCGYARMGLERGAACPECAARVWHSGGVANRHALKRFAAAVTVGVVVVGLVWLEIVTSGVVWTSVVAALLLAVRYVRRRSRWDGIGLVGVLLLIAVFVLAETFGVRVPAFDLRSIRILVAGLFAVIAWAAVSRLTLVRRLGWIAGLILVVVNARAATGIVRTWGMRSEARAVARWIEAEHVRTGSRPISLERYEWRRAGRADHLRYRTGLALPLSQAVDYRIDIRAGHGFPWRLWYGEPGGWRIDPW